ncbi:thioredoxin [Spiroplasma clarkii]|uniref:Thioredoxin n=1 Tax=Spiroplasma clarkii TaxID=2139 RepID=A0A1Y0L2I3_9MOLU|nr:thioredoxin [Spiroplasma clarkii]ARU92222.1 thioredoxin [Spiroplasma clarkii]ATX71544.1 thioredoxin [Spiroplasma clarkii]
MAKIISTVKEFDKITSEGVTLVDFYADWCGPCKMLGPIFEQASTEVSGVNFIKVDTDALPEIANRFEVASIPTIIKIVDGKEETRKVGVLGKDQLLALVK